MISAERLFSEILNIYIVKVVAKLQFKIYRFIVFIRKLLLHTYTVRGNVLSHILAHAFICTAKQVVYHLCTLLLATLLSAPKVAASILK